MSRRYGIHLTGRDAAEVQASARAAESAGLDFLWASELYTNPLVSLAAAACATSRIQLASGVLLAFVRSPLALGLQALDMDALCGGRFHLGLGTGAKRLNEDWHGVEKWGPPVRHMREVIAFLRDFTCNAHRGRPIVHRGEFVDVEMRGYRRPYPPARPRIPIMLGAMHKGMLRLLGEAADGWLGHIFLSPRYIERAVLPPIGEGLARSGRDRDALTLAAGLTVAIDPDRATARRHAAGPIAFYATVKTYQPVFAADGFAAEVSAIRAAWDAGDKRGALDGVTDAMIDTYCAAGTADEVRAGLARFDGLVDVVGLSPPRHFCPPDAHAAYRRRALELVG